MHLNLINPSFFRADDLSEIGSQKRVKIKNVTEEKMAARSRNQAHRLVHEHDKRGLVLNRTNKRTLQLLSVTMSTVGPARSSSLYPTMAEFRGKMGPAMRVRIPPPKEANKAPASPPKQTPKPVEDEDVDGFDDPEQLDDDISDVP